MDITPPIKKPLSRDQSSHGKQSPTKNKNKGNQDRTRVQTDNTNNTDLKQDALIHYIELSVVLDQLNQIASKNGLIIVENEEPDGDGSLWDLRDRELETVILSFSEHQLRQMFEMAQLIEFEECDLAGLGMSLTV